MHQANKLLLISVMATLTACGGGGGGAAVQRVQQMPGVRAGADGRRRPRQVQRAVDPGLRDVRRAVFRVLAGETQAPQLLREQSHRQVFHGRVRQ